MRKNIFIFILLSSILICVPTKVLFAENDSVKYIIIACSGPGSIATSSLIISAEKIDTIRFDSNNYMELIKYNSFENHTVSEVQFKELFEYLKQSKIDAVRLPSDSPYNILTVDYRKLKSEDNLLLTFKAGSMTEAIFFIKNLYCFMIKHEFSNDILDFVKIKIFENYLLDGYDASQFYSKKIKCY
jgi:hypothetical protein